MLARIGTVNIRSTLIRVEPTPGGHRVRLFVENGNGDWKEESAADLPPLPDAPRREEIRKMVLEQNGASPVFADIGRELHEDRGWTSRTPRAAACDRPSPASFRRSLENSDDDERRGGRTTFDPSDALLHQH